LLQPQTELSQVDHSQDSHRPFLDIVPRRCLTG
jgi:hypothetical protein